MATGKIAASIRTWIKESKRIVVLTGAGISTESGIPPFRGPQGVWTKDPEAEKLSDIHYYVADPEVRKKSWQSRLAHPAWTAQPNAGHMAIVELERRGKLHALITQNIDGLHQKAGNSPARVIEVHGTVHKVVCLSCGRKGPMQATLDRVRGAGGEAGGRALGDRERAAHALRRHRGRGAPERNRRDAAAHRRDAGRGAALESDLGRDDELN